MVSGLTTAFAILAALMGRHPIHSSSAILTLAPGTERALIVLRVYAEDFPSGQVAATAAPYLAARFTISDREGRRISLHLDGMQVEASVLVLRLSAPIPGGLSGARVWHGILAERFPDQVNILQARYGGRTVSLLFTSRDGPKPLP